MESIIKDNLEIIEQFSGMLELKKIFVLKMDFAFEPERKIPQPYEATVRVCKLGLAPREDELAAVLSFEIDGSAEGSKLFNCHFDYQISFQHDNASEVEAMLKNEVIQKVFLEKQCMKMVWPYLRQAFDRLMSDAGLATKVLPLLR